MIKIFFSDSDKIGAKLIRAATWSEYSHVGLIDSVNNTVIDSRFSAGGVSEYPIDELYSQYPRILVTALYDVPHSAIDIARTQIGKKYDWTALAGLWMHRDWQRDDSWFCSELVAWCCKVAGYPIINKQSGRVTPQDLFEFVSIMK